MRRMVLSRMVWVGIALAIFCWIVEAAMDALAFQEGTLVGNLLPGDAHEIWTRSLMACAFVAFGIYAQLALSRHERTEWALRESESKFRALVENIPGAVYRCKNDTAWTMHYLSDAIEGISGYAATALIENRERRFSEIIHPDDRDRVWQTVQDGARENGAYSLEYRINHRDGGVRWVLERGRGIRTEDGDTAVPQETMTGAPQEVRWLDGVILDITDRKLAEEAVRYRLQFEDIIASISANFINLSPTEIDEEINRALVEIGEFADVDRSYVFQYDDTQTRMDNTHEWCREGIESQRQRLQGLRINDFYMAREVLAKTRVVQISRVRDLPPEADSDRKEFEAEGIQSLVCVPLICEDVHVGFVGFDSVRVEKSWSEDTLSLLQFVGNVLASALVRKRTAEVLEASEDRFRLLVETAKAVILCLSPDHRIMEFNPEAERLYGRRRDEVVGKDYLGLFVPESERDAFTADVEKVLAGEPTIGYETTVLTYDGTERVLSWNVNRLGVAGGNSDSVICVGVDVTDRRQVEHALRESEARLQSIFRAAPVGIGLVSTRVLKHVNERVCEMTGYALEELVGRDARFLYPTDEDYEFVGREKCRQIAERGTGTAETRWQRKDGTVFDILLGFTPLDPENLPTGVTFTALDLTERKRTEQALRERDEMIRSIVETSQDWIWSIDRQGVHTYSNPAIESILGHKLEDILGRSILRLMHEDDRAAIEARLPEWIAKRSGWDNQLIRWRHKDGSYRYLESNAVPILDSQGELVGYRGVDRDVTKRRRAEEQLLEKEYVIESASSAIGTADLDGKVTYVNPAFLTMWGFEGPGDVLGKHFSEFWEVQERLDEIMTALREDGVWSDEIRARQKDGTLFDVQVSAAMVHDKAGDPVSLMSSCVDITERKRAEEALLRGEERYRDFIAGNLMGIYRYELRKPMPVSLPLEEQIAWIMDEAVVAEGNDAAALMYGYSSVKDGIGLTYREAMRADEQGAEAMLRAWIEGGYRLDATESHQKLPTGEYRWILLTNHGVIENECLIRSWGTTVDITETKEAEKEKSALREQLHQAQKMEAVGQLASGVAHDFNNLLTAITGYVELAKTSLPRDHSAVEALVGVEQAAQQAVGVTRSLLTFSCETPAKKGPVELCGVVRKTLRLLSRVLPNSISVETDVTDGPGVWVLADATQLQQIVMNLSINARDAMPDGGTLQIKVSGPVPDEAVPVDALEQGETTTTSTDLLGATARLSVCDTGEGIHPDTLVRIFEPFFTTKVHGQGTGLGLSIIHGIVQDHGGRMEVQSKVGRGSTFTVVLPALKETLEVERDGPVPVAKAGQGQVILVAEDNWNVRSIIATSLEALGYRILEASDGDSLLESFEQHRNWIRLLITDLDLPKRGGLDCMREIRRHGGRIPAIAITGSVDVTVETELDRDTTLLRKPFSMGQLGGLVNHLLGAQHVEGPNT